MMFKKAERKQARLRLGLSGPSGSGKTYSALLIAKGIGNKIAVLDTEKGSASLYANLFDFDTVELSPPFTSDKYIKVIKGAEQAGYDVLIIDSLSHAWMGEGGALEQKASLDKNAKSNQYANWRQPKEEFSKLKNAMIFSSIHVICTLRAKQSYEQTVDETGKKRIEKMGLDPQIEPGAEYELTTIFDMQMNHHAVTSKDRTNLFDGKVFLPSEETGKSLLAWLNDGVSQSNLPAPPPQISDKRTRIVSALSGRPFKYAEEISQRELHKSCKDLSDEEFDQLIKLLEYVSNVE